MFARMCFMGYWMSGLCREWSRIPEVHLTEKMKEKSTSTRNPFLINTLAHSTRRKSEIRKIAIVKEHNPREKSLWRPNRILRGGESRETTTVGIQPRHELWSGCYVGIPPGTVCAAFHKVPLLISHSIASVFLCFIRACSILLFTSNDDDERGESSVSRIWASPNTWQMSCAWEKGNRRESLSTHNRRLLRTKVCLFSLSAGVMC